MTLSPAPTASAAARRAATAGAIVVAAALLAASPAPAQAPPPGGNGAAAVADYRLAVGDKLRVEVYKDPQLSQSLQIRPDGRITIPLIGDLPAAGLTPTELSGSITESLREYITDPVVTVIVAETVPPVVYVMGEVNSPGTLSMTGPLTVLQALAMAGGFREFANTRDVRVLRRGARGLETLRFNYRDALRGTTHPLDLQPGDTIIVP
jgi:polysaccharide biosynthesis/export protein